MQPLQAKTTTWVMGQIMDSLAILPSHMDLVAIQQSYIGSEMDSDQTKRARIFSDLPASSPQQGPIAPEDPAHDRIDPTSRGGNWKPTFTIG